MNAVVREDRKGRKISGLDAFFTILAPFANPHFPAIET